MNNEVYPKPLVRVTGGPGGEAVLIKGSKKTALYDCGMACFEKELLKNLKNALDGRPLDYVLLSHTHYDHMGALPYIIKIWPKVKVCGSLKAAQVFQRKSAVDMIVFMGKSAAEFYGEDPQRVKADGIRIDVILKEGDIITLGKEEILALETRGHTDCSMSYFMQPYGLLLASESTGVLLEEGEVHTSVLKSFEESIESAYLLKILPYKEVLVPHYGILPEDIKESYFDMFIEAAQRERSFIEECIGAGMKAEEIFLEHKKLYWKEERASSHPYKAYKINTEIVIKRMLELYNYADYERVD